MLNGQFYTLVALSLGKAPLLCDVYLAGWTPGLGWTLSRKKHVVPLPGITAWFVCCSCLIFFNASFFILGFLVQKQQSY